MKNEHSIKVSRKRVRTIINYLQFQINGLKSVYTNKKYKYLSSNSTINSDLFNNEIDRNFDNREFREVLIKNIIILSDLTYVRV